MAKDQEFPTSRDDYYHPISPIMIFPEAHVNFAVYMKIGRHYVLYTRKGEEFTERHRNTLYENGVEEVYIHGDHKAEYNDYVERNLAPVLLNESLPVEMRSKIFYHSSTGVIRDALHSRLPAPLGEQMHKRILEVVKASVRFLCKKEALKTLASLMSHDYQTYSHCTNVFIYALSILETYDPSEEDKIQCGLGAILHDIGKLEVPNEILNKPRKLNREEWDIIKTHPVRGVGLCALMPLDPVSIKCILFHHEKCDGSGYPTGLSQAQIPLPARIVAVADIYDAITSKRAYAEAVSPFKALSIMREEMNGQLDSDVFKRLVLILSGAKLV